MIENEKCPLCQGDVIDDVCTVCEYKIPNIEKLADKEIVSLKKSGYYNDFSEPPVREIDNVTHLCDEIYPKERTVAADIPLADICENISTGQTEIIPVVVGEETPCDTDENNSADKEKPSKIAVKEVVGTVVAVIIAVIFLLIIVGLAIIIGFKSGGFSELIKKFSTIISLITIIIGVIQLTKGLKDDDSLTRWNGLKLMFVGGVLMFGTHGL